MIPNVLALGFIAGLFGRRGLWFVVAAALIWPITLTLTGVGTGLGFWIAAVGYAALNGVVGVVTGNAVLRLARSARRLLPSRPYDAS